MLRAALQSALRIPALTFTLTLTLALAIPACGSETTSLDPTTGEAEEAIARNAPPLAGTYEADPFAVGDFARLVLETDGSYHASVAVRCSHDACVTEERSGLYRMSYSRMSTYLTLFDHRMIGEQYQVRWDRHLLLVRAIEARAFQVLGRAEIAWCALPRDCAMQALPPGPCAGHYECRENACAMVCSASPPPAF
jgi:hypothetical protein